MTLIKNANLAFRQKKYKEAIDLYKKIIAQENELKSIVEFNLNLAVKHIEESDKKILTSNDFSKNCSVKNESNDLFQISLEESMKIVRDSGYFDKDWYLTEYSDVARNSKINPLSHFVRNGGKEKRNPSKKFNTRFYLEKYDELIPANVNPLIHFLLIGRKKGLLPREEIPEISTWWASGFDKTLNNKFDVYEAIQRMNKNNAPVAIVVPVFNALKELKACIYSVIENTNHNYRLILINDFSSDPNISVFLNSLLGIKKIEVYHNEVNRGFTFTVNRGIQIAGKSDVVLLNSDTCVTPNWLTNLRLAAYSQDKSATATPFSNNAGAYSAPILGQENFIPDGYSLNDWARAINQASKRIYAAAPTGHGFCMYVRRDCIDEIGALDEKAFPKGYGEENDFCMRAISNGWKNIVVDSTYIYHVRSASFGAAKTELLKKGRAVVDQRYPNYTGEVREFLKQSDVNSARDNIRIVEQKLKNQNAKIKPRALYVLATKTGGTPQTNQDLMVGVASSFETFVLYSNTKKIDLFYFCNGVYYEVDSKILNESINVFPHRSEEYDKIVSQWIIEYAIEIVHIRHIAWHSHGLVDMSRSLGIPVIFSLHDFYTVCPTVKLLDGDKNYCGGRCTKTEKSCSYDLWKGCDLPLLKNSAIHDWREMNEILFKKCDAFITTSTYAKKVLIQNYPFLSKYPFFVVPHGRDFLNFTKPLQKINSDEVIKILFPGNITLAKGGKIIEELALKRKKLNIEVHILGKVSSNIDTSNLILHGEYARDDFVDKVNEINPHIGGVLSIWPETHCHTLTELWAAGIPVIGFDIGAVGERIRKTGAGWIISNFTCKDVEDCLKLVRENGAEYTNAANALLAWQKNDALSESCAVMAEKYIEIYRNI